MGTKISDKANKHRENAIQAYEAKKNNLITAFLKSIDQKSDDLSLKKNTSNLFRNAKPSKNTLDVRNFTNIISIDKNNLVAELEGMATYEKIVNETLKYDCLPCVVPELKSITIGGALAGVGIESSSFRYGLVHESILEYELFLSDGRIVICRPDNEHKALYYAFPNTYGSLGYALKVKVKLIPVKKYVKLTHFNFTDPTQYFAWLEKTCTQNRAVDAHFSYIDGVIFHKNNLYGTLGELVDEVPCTSNYQYRNIFFQSIKQKKTDYLTTKDYIWRWDTDWFWCSKHFGMQNSLLRLIFGKFMLKSTVYWKIKTFFNRNRVAKYCLSLIMGKSESVIQDIQVPIEEAKKFLDFFQDEIGIKPIWICPVKALKTDVQYSFYKMDPNRLYINFGFWDMIPSNHPKGFYNTKIEQKVQELGGNKSLYSTVFYTENEFWNIYDRSLYLALKKVYDPDHKLTDLYQKCTHEK